MIAPMAQMFLFGTEIDYEISLLESGFKFRNPNVVDACGCGESIKFADVETLQANSNKFPVPLRAPISYARGQQLSEGTGCDRNWPQEIGK